MSFNFSFRRCSWQTCRRPFSANGKAVEVCGNILGLHLWSGDQFWCRQSFCFWEDHCHVGWMETKTNKGCNKKQLDEGFGESWKERPGWWSLFLPRVKARILTDIGDKLTVTDISLSSVKYTCTLILSEIEFIHCQSLSFSPGNHLVLNTCFLVFENYLRFCSIWN